MGDKTLKQVKDIKRGEYILTQGNQKAKVLCLVKFNCQDGFTNLCTLKNGLKITPKHPVMNEDGQWIYPSQLATPEYSRCAAVYNLIVD